MPVEIRDACPNDYADWRKLWNGYLSFYKNLVDENVTASTWARITDPLGTLRMRVAVPSEPSGVAPNLVGFAIHHRHVSTWNIQPSCYLEDLFVDPDFRGQGIGHRLIDDVIACSADCSKIYWHTDKDNATARKLYDTYCPADSIVRYSVLIDP